MQVSGKKYNCSAVYDVFRSSIFDLPECFPEEEETERLRLSIVNDYRSRPICACDEQLNTDSH